MFIGARVAFTLGNLMRAGVIINARNDLKFDDDSVMESADIGNLVLINSWMTYKKAKEIGDFKTYPNHIEPSAIFINNKPIKFSVAGLRSFWYYFNNVVFDNKLREPIFRPTEHRTNWGEWVPKTRAMLFSTRNHSFRELATTVCHEMIHQMNTEIEHSPYHKEGIHGAAFRRWIPIIKDKTGLDVGANSYIDKDVTDFSDDKTVAEEETTKPFIFVIFKIKGFWYGLLCDDRVNLPMLSGEAASIIAHNGSDSKIYAGYSNLVRVKKELITTKNGNVGKLRSPFSPSLVNLLAKTCIPITGYRTPVTIELKGNN